jgi:dUTP pyrophosphatase
MLLPSISKKGLRLSNAVGVIDSGYRGELIVKFDKTGEEEYLIGDRVAQFMVIPLPSIQFVEVGELSDTVRGAGGFGSSGN